jgi:hypothetical protein
VTSGAGFERVLGDFLAALRRAGLAVGPAESIDAHRAAVVLGLERRAELRAGLRATVVKSVASTVTFDRVFDAFFAADSGPTIDPRERLRESGLTEDEVEALMRAIAAADAAAAGGSGLGLLVGGAEALEGRLAEAASTAALHAIRTSLQVGFFTQRVLEHAGLGASRLPALSDALDRELGPRAAAAQRALEAELRHARTRARTLVARALDRHDPLRVERFRHEALEARPFVRLSPDEAECVEAEVRRLADRLRGRIAVRRRRARRGRLDVRRTLRASLRTGGVPFRLVLVRRRPTRPRLVVLTDISDSVRFAARFLLMLVHAMQEAFVRTRTFVFVRDVGESTAFFATYPVGEAMALVASGAAVSVASHSDYGAALTAFAERYADALDSRTTVVLLGDGRTNYLEPGAATLGRIRERVAKLYWLNPEPRASWGFGDSAMPSYLPHVDRALVVSDLASLRAAVEALLRR